MDEEYQLELVLGAVLILGGLAALTYSCSCRRHQRHVRIEGSDVSEMEDVKEGPAQKPHILKRLAAPSVISLGTILIAVGMVKRMEPSRPAILPPLPPSFHSSAPPTTPPIPPPPRRVPLIIDTDMAFDVDDVGAVCAAHALADLGEAEILLIVHDAGLFEGIGAVATLNTYYGRAQTPLGAFKGRFGDNVRGPYVHDLVTHFPSLHKNYSKVLGCGEAYRKALSQAGDSSVAIAAIGFTTCLRELLASAADSYSPLSGYDLVAQKVDRIVFQGGWYAPLHPDGHETFNWDCGRGWGFHPEDDGCTWAAQYVLEHMPPNVRLIFSDVGDEVYHGGGLTTCAGHESPCRQAYVDYLGPHGSRPSWDPVVVVLAVRGPTALHGSLTDVGWHNRADGLGANFWAPTRRNNTRESVFILNGVYPGWRLSRAAVGMTLENLLCTKPVARGP